MKNDDRNEFQGWAPTYRQLLVLKGLNENFRKNASDSHRYVFYPYAMTMHARECVRMEKHRLLIYRADLCLLTEFCPGTDGDI